MLHALRSRGLALTTLMAFLVAQPVVGCVALCFFGTHSAGAHPMAGMDRSNATVGGDACHASSVGTAQHDLIQPLSAMEPTPTAVIAFAAPRVVEPAHTIPTPPPVVSRAVESPPPRFV